MKKHRIREYSPIWWAKGILEVTAAIAGCYLMLVFAGGF